MNLNLAEVVSAQSFQKIDLQDRARLNPPGGQTRCYRVSADGEEVAFLALTRWQQPEINALVIYEMFVTRARRFEGIGSQILSEVEQMAISEGFTAVHLVPRALDSVPDDESLLSWYHRHGYSWKDNATGEMEKILVQ